MKEDWEARFLISIIAIAGMWFSGVVIRSQKHITDRIERLESKAGITQKP